MIHYILQVVLFQLLFLVVYDLFLKKETFFNYNRLYLLLTSVVSFVLPFIRIEALQQTIPESFRVQLPAVILGTSSSEITTNSIALEEVLVTQQSLLWSQGALWVYGIGAFIALFLFGLKLRKLYVLKKTAHLENLKNHTIAIVPNTDVAFTFLNTIFLGAQLSEPQRSSIVQHELVHVKQRHTVDLLFFEMLRILFWFNPMVYLFQQKLQALHEYTADRLVASKNKPEYYQELLSQVFGTTNISFINTFYKSSFIKNRIVMLQKSRSKKIFQLKYLLLIPAVCAMLFYTSCTEDSTSQSGEPDLSQYTYSLHMGEEMSPETKATHNAYESFLKTNNKEYVAWVSKEGDVLTYSVHKRKEKVPSTYRGKMKFDFPDGSNYDAFMQLPKSKTTEADGGLVEYKSVDDYLDDPNAVNKKYTEPLNNRKGTVTVQKLKDQDPNREPDVPFAAIDKAPAYPGCSGSNQDLKECFTEKVTQYVSKNFNTKLANDIGLVGRQRISVQFMVDKSGDIVDIRARAPHPDLEEEAIRIVSGLPRMIPGEQDGKKVRVIYALPIIFQIDE